MNSSINRFPQLSPESKAQIQRANRQRACSECSRLKLRCDRKLPACGSCVRRHVEFLCPNGTQAQAAYETKPTTPVLENDRVTLRVQALEDALAILQSSISAEPHPLLRDDLLKLKYGDAPTKLVVSKRDQLTDAFGTLTIGQYGDTKYFGPSAGHESLFQAGAEMESISYAESPTSALGHGSIQFPLLGSELSFGALIPGLPDKHRAWSLTETYLEQGRWNGKFIDRDELINELLTPVYNFRNQNDLESFQEKLQAFSTHKLAVLFLVFTIGALVDLTVVADSAEADGYFQSARAVLSLHSIASSPEIATVQALALMCQCHSQGGRQYNPDAAWTYISLAAKRSQSIGLRDEYFLTYHARINCVSDRECPPQWNLDVRAVNRRRTLFWEIFVVETFLSLNLGRPPSIRLSYVDCEFPEDEESKVDDHGETLPGPDRWKYMFVKEVLSTVLERALTAAPPSYSTTLELDRLLREFHFPPDLRVCLTGFSEDDDTTPHLYMRRHILTMIRASVGLYIHRSQFAQALLQYRDDPMGSPYCNSFLASYRSASAIIALYVKHFTLPHISPLLLRWWLIWGSLFSATMVVGSIVIHCPRTSMSSKAYMELGLATALFEKGAEVSPRARSGLVILRKLMDKATKIFSRDSNDEAQPPPVDQSDYLGEELEMFAGYTKVLVSKLLSSRRQYPQPSSERTASSSSRTCLPTGSVPNPLSPDLMSEWLMDPSSFNPPEVPYDPSDLEPAGQGPHPEWLSFMQDSGFFQ